VSKRERKGRPNQRLDRQKQLSNFLIENNEFSLLQDGSTIFIWSRDSEKRRYFASTTQKMTPIGPLTNMLATTWPFFHTQMDGAASAHEKLHMHK